MDSIVTGALQDRYELLSEIGRGGFGVVYKARQRTTQQLVAIKVLDLAAASDLATRSEQRNRFTREMELIAQLTSPHVVRLVDAGFSGDDPFMALEYLRGQELAEVIWEAPSNKSSSSCSPITSFERLPRTCHCHCHRNCEGVLGEVS